jgi:cytochrome P450
MLLSATGDSAADKMTDKELRDEVMTLVLAGHETTANALVWTLCLLARHPAIMEQLRGEVDSVLGDRDPTFDDLPALEYTERVMKESMRLFPPAWCFERLALDDDVIAGYKVPKGTTIIIAPYTLHRSPRCWTSPEIFDPDRFHPSRADRQLKSVYLPFGDGPRICIGKGFAMMEAKIALSMIVRSYDISLALEGPIPMEAGVTLRPRGKVYVRATKRYATGARKPGRR